MASFTNSTDVCISKKTIECSDVEWKTRVELAALFRILAHYKMDDVANGGVAARCPDDPMCYLTHPYGMFWEEATASMMVKINSEGKAVEEGGPWLNDGLQNLCVWIFGSRPDVNFFIHGHEEEVMAVGSIEGGLLPLNQPAIYLGSLLAYIEYNFDEQGDFPTHFIKTLDTNQIIISHNHGDYVCGDTAACAFFRAYYLRQTCSAQIKTLSMQRPLHLIPQELCDKYRAEMAKSNDYNYNGKTEWPGLIRMLDRCDQSQSYAT